MKPTRRNVAITAGLTAVLALSPVIVPAASAFAEGNAAAAASQGVSDGYRVFFSVTNPDTGNQESMNYYDVKDGSAQRVDTSQVPDVSRDGWELVGWKDSISGRIYSATDLGALIVNGNTTFTTVWKSTSKPGVSNGYRVFFSVTNPDTGNQESMNYYDVKDGSAQRVDTSQVPDASYFEGWELVGWKDSINGDTYSTADLGSVIVSEDTTFTTVWKRPDTAVHTINFHDEDGNGIGTVANAGDVAFSVYTDMLAEGVADPYKDGYTFDGWVTKSGDKILPTDVISGDLDLYPSFKKNAAVYTVNFFDEDGNGICTISLAGDHTLEDFLTALYQTDGVQVPFKDGCYIEWTTKSGDRVLSTDTIQGTLNLYANFKQSPATHTVNFFDKDGNGLGTIALTGDQPLSAYTDALATGNVEAPYVEGYTFTGWTTKSGDSVLPTDVISGDLNLYATYQKNAAVHTINFFDEDGNGLGTIANAGDVAFSVYTDMLAEGVQVPEKDGYIFSGWVTKSGDKILATDTISGDLNVYASYEKVSEPETVYHKVTFDDCLESTENAVVVVEDGQPVAAPADPTCEGYTFQGWYSDTDLTQEWDFTTPVTEDMTLWAKWEKNADESTPSGDETTGETTDEATDGTASETPTTPSEQAAEEAAAAQADDAMPNTGDATIAVSGIAGLGAALAGVGAFLKRRRS